MPQTKYFFKQGNKDQLRSLFRVLYLFPTFLLTVLIFTNCQLPAVHVDCPTGDCPTDNEVKIAANEPTFSGYYRLKTKFRGETESLDDGQGLVRAPNGGVFMNLNEDSPHQLWRFDTLDNGFMRLKSKAGGDTKSLEANEAKSLFHDGTTFMDNQLNVIGQLWYLEQVTEEYYHLKTSLYPNECLEGNEINGMKKGGAAFMSECSSVQGQLWKLEMVME